MISNPSHPAGTTTVGEVVDAIDAMTGGRISAPPGVDNPWYVVKSSGLPGKAVTETPGLVLGDRRDAVRRLAVVMTVTEHDIELARAIGVDLIVAHHPVADAASAGGVALRDYLPRYGLSVIECHEAFHGLHPGIGFLHGHAPFFHHGSFGGVHGKVVMVGRPLVGVDTLADVLSRIRTILSRDVDEAVLAQERAVRGNTAIADSVTAPGLQIVHGHGDDKLGEKVIHAFPHTGFNGDDLALLVEQHPEVGTLVLSISSAGPDDELVQAAAGKGLNVIVGSSHATEILENGVPLAMTLHELLPGVDVLLFRNRVVALPLEVAATGALAEYGRRMADHLVRGAVEGRAS